MVEIKCCSVLYDIVSQILYLTFKLFRLMPGTMNYGKKSPSMGTPSVYSHVTTRSSANLRSSRSVKSVKIPWYQKRILTSAYILDIQRGAMVASVYSLVSEKCKKVLLFISSVLELLSLTMKIETINFLFMLIKAW